jgi:transposase
MTNQPDVLDTCCVALELSQSTWICGFSSPLGGKCCIKIAPGDVRALVSFLQAQHEKAEREAGRSLSTVVCYEAGYDGFWLARLGLLALHGIRLASKGIGKRLRDRLLTLRTGDGRGLPPFLRRDIERMLRHHDFICGQIAEVEADRRLALKSEVSSFPCRDKVHRLAKLGGVGETTATVLVAEVYHRSFATRRHLASYIGLAPSPYASGQVSRDRGINKAGTKLARQTLVELAWFWLRYQPQSGLSRWWQERFAGKGMRGRKVGIVALARKLAIALWRFVEHGVVPEDAVLKA